MNDRAMFILGALCGLLGGLVLDGIILIKVAELQEEGAAQREQEFRKAESRWNWELLDQQKSCSDAPDLLACTSFITAYDGAFGPERQKMVAWACTWRACTWLLEP